MNYNIVHGAFDALPYLCLKILGFVKWAKKSLTNTIFCCLRENCYERRRVRC